MKEITAHMLREMVRDAILPSIRQHRLSKHSKGVQLPDQLIADEEIDCFLYSNPHLHYGLVYFLSDRYAWEVVRDVLLVDTDWKNEFMEKLACWARSREWLEDDTLELVHHYSAENRRRQLHTVRLPFRIRMPGLSTEWCCQ
jgi:hypothetical protein